jgi:hypothetical protein
VNETLMFADTYYALRDELDLIRDERDALAGRLVEREREIAYLRAMLPSYWVDRRFVRQIEDEILAVQKGEVK